MGLQHLLNALGIIEGVGRFCLDVQPRLHPNSRRWFSSLRHPNLQLHLAVQDGQRQVRGVGIAQPEETFTTDLDVVRILASVMIPNDAHVAGEGAVDGQQHAGVDSFLPCLLIETVHRHRVELLA